MPPNGPAIKRAERIKIGLWAILAKEPACRGAMLPDVSTGHSPTSLARKWSRCNEGMARLPSPKAGRFCSPRTSFIEHYECRGTSLLSGREIVPLQYVLNGHWCGRGISITDLSWVQEEKQKP